MTKEGKTIMEDRQPEIPYRGPEDMPPARRADRRAGDRWFRVTLRTDAQEGTDLREALNRALRGTGFALDEDEPVHRLARDHESGPYLPPGPALLYVHSEAGFRTLRPERTVTQVDLSLPTGGGPVSDAEARRERQILRGLLEHALWLLDRDPQ